MEETNNTDNVLETVNGVFVDNVLDTLEVPKMTFEEADSYKEAEKVEIEEEGGK